MAWWDTILGFLLGVLNEVGYVLGVQFLNIAILWQLLPVYTAWFAIQFITKHREEQDVSNRFMNSFSLLWVGFELGNYIIENIFKDPYILWKIFAVVSLFSYAIFVMRLTFLRRDITRYLARISEISAINIAALLFVQDLIIITSALQLIQVLIAFILIYAGIDFGIIKLIDYLYLKLKVPEEEEEKKEEAPEIPRYERITTTPTPPVTTPAQKTITPPVIRPPTQGIPIQPPIQGTQTQVIRPTTPVTPSQPIAQKPIIKKTNGEKAL